MINKYSFINIYEHKKKNSKLSSQILYGEKFTILKEFKDCGEKAFFENQEDLEINRFLELDFIVNCIELKKGGKAVDTVEDLEIVKKLINTNQFS